MSNCFSRQEIEFKWAIRRIGRTGRWPPSLQWEIVKLKERQQHSSDNKNTHSSNFIHLSKPGGASASIGLNGGLNSAASTIQTKGLVGEDSMTNSAVKLYNQTRTSISTCLTRFSAERIRKLYYKQAILFGIGMLFFVPGVVCTVMHFLYRLVLQKCHKRSQKSPEILAQK